MSQPYVGEIRVFAGNFAPTGWMFCEGQLLPISENETLFQLIGTTYGGDGQSSFALPDLRGRLPVHMGNGLVLGEIGGSEQLPASVSNNLPEDFALARGLALGGVPTPALRVPDERLGGEQSLGCSYIISLLGIFPSPS